MKKLFALAATLMLTVGLMLAAVPRQAQAVSCPPPKFSLEVTPSTVEEDGTVLITVENEQQMNVGNPQEPDSSVDLKTVDETAKDGKDYTGVYKRLWFYGYESMQFTVPITKDYAAEPAETFKVRLSDPYYNCDPNNSSAPTDPFVLPAPVTVTIAANAAASTQPATSPPPKTVPSGTTPPTTSAAPLNSSAPGQSPAPSGSSQSTSSFPVLTDTAGLGLASTPPPGATNVEQAGKDLPDAPGAEVSESPSPLIQAQGKSGGGNKAATLAFIAVIATAGAGIGLWKLRRTKLS